MYTTASKYIFDSCLISTAQKMNFSILRSIISNSKTQKKFYRKASVKLMETNENDRLDEETNLVDNSKFTDNLIKWAIQNNISGFAFTKLLKVLKEYGIEGLPSTSKALLLAKEDNIKVSKVPPGIYTHFGFQKNLENLMLVLIEKNMFHKNNISVSIFIDELPLVKFTHQGAYWGFSKPNCSNLFLSEFVKEAKDLTEKGLKINNVIYNVEISRLICDAPAKVFVLNIKNFKSYSSCTKCNAIGKFKSKNICFLEKSTPRKDEDFEKKEMYVNDKTCLLEIPNFGVVSNVTIDYMHLVCLGVVKKLLTIWTSNDQYWINQNSVSDKLKNINLEYPCEFQRGQIFKLNQLSTASDFRQFLLYYGPVILKNNLKENYYNHFLLLHVACRLLCIEASKENIDCGRQLLYNFVESYTKLYETEQITHNTHGLYHLADECVSHGILDNFSSFPFEKFLVKLKSTIEKNKRKLIPQTLLRESYDKIFRNNLACLSSVSYSVGKKIKISEDNEFKDFFHFVKLSLSNCNIIPGSKGDNYVFLKNGKIIKVTNVLQKKEKPKEYLIAGKEFCSVSNFHSRPFESLKLGMFIVRELSDTVGLWPIDLIEKKGMNVPVENDESVLISFLHKNF